MFPPSLADFVEFVRDDMGIDADALPDGSKYFAYAFGMAQEAIPFCSDFSVMPITYSTALLNLGGHYLIQITPDVDPSTFFEDLRTGFKMNSGFKPGLVNSSSDNGTSASAIVSPAMANLSLADLMLMSTPYGRIALAFLQELGSYWGLS